MDRFRSGYRRKSRKVSSSRPTIMTGDTSGSGETVPEPASSAPSRLQAPHQKAPFPGTRPTQTGKTAKTVLWSVSRDCTNESKVQRERAVAFHRRSGRSRPFQYPASLSPAPLPSLNPPRHTGRSASRQMLKSNERDSSEHTMITERDSTDPQLLESYSSRALNEKNRQAALRQVAGYNPPSTPEETMVIEALQEHRERREQAASRNTSLSRPNLSSNMSSLMERLHNNRQQREIATKLGRNNSSSMISNSRQVGDIISDVRSQRNRLHNQSGRLFEQSERVRARRLAVEKAERQQLSGSSIDATATGGSRMLNGHVHGENIHGNASTVINNFHAYW